MIRGMVSFQAEYDVEFAPAGNGAARVVLMAVVDGGGCWLVLFAVGDGQLQAMMCCNGCT